jgi:hypothetical protein
MAPIQTTYGFDYPVGFEGQLADINGYQMVTGVLEGAVNIPFGVGLKKGAASDDGYLLPTLVGDLIEGISVHSHSRDNLGFAALAPADAGVKPAQNFNVLRKGSVYVKVEEAVAAHDVVFVRYAAGAGGTQLGAFRKSADTATAAQLKGARYLTGALAGGIAKVSFDANAAAQP